ncbi:MAG: hypothetical protein TV41_07565 [Wolbachia endosymbiont of Dactylopius coccus]|nr:MAG: hypothetical protein TV41_01875 [Wolbachia endosymbiont of Dactylopius coccus]OAM06384.1 MAG: hypothetical protein TV41_07565 [Wolbachia endosymbiont of Dactylopius coccus]
MGIGITSAYFIGVSLSVGAMAGIAVAAAVLTGLVAGGIIYEVLKPCDELKEAIAKKISKLSQNSAVDDSKPDCSLENPGTSLLAPLKCFINNVKSF